MMLGRPIELCIASFITSPNPPEPICSSISYVPTVGSQRDLFARCKALELVNPVEHDDEIGRLCGFAGEWLLLDHEETLAVR